MAKEVVFNGKRYPSICAAMRSVGCTLSRQVVSLRMRHGWSLEKAILTPLVKGNELKRRLLAANGKPVKLSDGREFPTIKAAAEFLGLPPGTVYYRNKRGLPVDVKAKVGRPRILPPKD